MSGQESGDRRPSPDALLEAARGEGRGRLKIFLGAAPGVGKTYEMLQTAQARLREGMDVVVGLVETHGRRETEALIAGLEVIPRRASRYRDRALEEMDLDAILGRRPQLVLVDELAHSNAPGSRHPKRYLDVMELLAAGIDVFTTLNIQHVESLNDVVAKITRIRVRETVPDSIIDRADEIEVVDLTPEDLVQRLKDGKVYVPQQAERAVRHYFSPGNLTALRELALRRTAQRVDEQMLSYMRGHAISGPWAAGERLLVCIDDTPGTETLVRHAKRLADRLRGPWTALHVEATGATASDEAAEARVADALRLALRLGGEAITLPGQDVAGTVVEYARTHNVTHIVVATRARGGWRGRFGSTVAQRIIRYASGINVHVLAEEPREAKAVTSSSPRPPARLPLAPGAGAGSLLAVAIALGVALLLARLPRHHQRGIGVPGQRARICRRVRAVGVAVRQPAQRARLQFLLPAAALHLYDRQS